MVLSPVPVQPADVRRNHGLDRDQEEDPIRHERDLHTTRQVQACTAEWAQSQVLTTQDSLHGSLAVTDQQGLCATMRCSQSSTHARSKSPTFRVS